MTVTVIVDKSKNMSHILLYNYRRIGSDINGWIGRNKNWRDKKEPLEFSLSRIIDYGLHHSAFHEFYTFCSMTKCAFSCSCIDEKNLIKLEKSVEIVLKCVLFMGLVRIFKMSGKNVCQKKKKSPNLFLKWVAKPFDQKKIAISGFPIGNCTTQIVSMGQNRLFTSELRAPRTKSRHGNRISK